MLLKEIQAWIDIYNKYKSKMPLYYMHSKSYHTLFKSIIDKSSNIQNDLFFRKYNYLKYL